MTLKRIERHSPDLSIIEEKSTPSLPIKERYEPAIEEFESADAFKAYLGEHADELDKLSTYKLNKRFHIKNYKISKLNGKISLVAQKESKIGVDELTIIKKRFAILEGKINQIIDFLTTSSH
jgi:hypothetical protein